MGSCSCFGEDEEERIVCGKCNKEFPYKEIELSHDIPKYAGGTDLDGRHQLCKNCHDKYEEFILVNLYKQLFMISITFSKDRRKNIPYMFRIKCLKKDKKKIVLNLRNIFFEEKEDDTKTT